MKEGACMAANGDEASISMSTIRVGRTVLEASWYSSIDSIEKTSAAGN
jgi:hypothetical protein